MWQVKKGGAETLKSAPPETFSCAVLFLQLFPGGTSRHFGESRRPPLTTSRTHSGEYARLSKRRPSPFFSSKRTLELVSLHPVRRSCNCPGLMVNEISRVFSGAPGEWIVIVASDAPPL